MVSEVTEVHARYFADYSARGSTKTHVASKLGSVTVLLRLVRQESGENWDKRCLRMAQRGFSSPSPSMAHLLEVLMIKTRC